MKRLAASLAALAVGLSPCASWARQTPPAPLTGETLKQLAQACSAEGAFGYRFGERRPGGNENRPLAVAPTADWPMLTGVLLGRTPRTATVVAITGVIGLSSEPDAMQAELALTIIDEVAAEADLRADFVTREDSLGVVFRSFDMADLGETARVPEGAFSLELYEEQGEAWLMCTDNVREGLIWDEAMGRGQTEPPVRPNLALGPRPPAGVCDDPPAAARLVASLEGLQDEVFASGQRGNRYFTDLNGWYGQQLKASGLWDKERGFEFAMEMLRDPAISNGTVRQMERLGDILRSLSGYGAAKEAGDLSAACEAGVEALNLGHDLVEVNRAQWDRLRALYHAEADRLGVPLTD